MTGRRVLLLSASMGAGHDAAAAELARRLTARGDEPVLRDLLALLPAGTGRLLRTSYGQMLHHAPWLYQGIYGHFFEPPARRRTRADPVVVLAERPVRRLLADLAPDAVVATFHLAAQVTGRLRSRRQLDVLSTVLVTDLVVHALWVHPGNDRHLCLHPSAVQEAGARGARDPLEVGPLVRPDFRRPAQQPSREFLAVPAGRAMVVLTAGAWGVGDLRRCAHVVARTGRYVPVVLCAHNQRLLDTLRREPGVVALGWRDDVPALVRTAHAVVQNAGGLSCWEALTAGRPVITYRPIPGHGRAAAERLDRLGLVPWARDDDDLVRMLDGCSSAATESEGRPVQDAAQLIA